MSISAKGGMGQIWPIPTVQRGLNSKPYQKPFQKIKYIRKNGKVVRSYLNLTTLPGGVVRSKPYLENLTNLTTPSQYLYQDIAEISLVNTSLLHLNFTNSNILRIQSLNSYEENWT